MIRRGIEWAVRESNLKSIYIEIEAEIDKSFDKTDWITFNGFEAHGWTAAFPNQGLLSDERNRIHFSSIYLYTRFRCNINVIRHVRNPFDNWYIVNPQSWITNLLRSKEFLLLFHVDRYWIEIIWKEHLMLMFSYFVFTSDIICVKGIAINMEWFSSRWIKYYCGILGMNNYKLWRNFNIINRYILSCNFTKLLFHYQKETSIYQNYFPSRSNQNTIGIIIIPDYVVSINYFSKLF